MMRQHSAKFGQIRFQRFERHQQQFAYVFVYQPTLGHATASAAGAFDGATDVRSEKYRFQWDDRRQAVFRIRFGGARIGVPEFCVF